MHWNEIAYDKHRCAMHWDCIAYDKNSDANAMEIYKQCIGIALLISIVVQCNRIKSAMH